MWLNLIIWKKKSPKFYLLVNLLNYSQKKNAIFSLKKLLELLEFFFSFLWIFLQFKKKKKIWKKTLVLCITLNKISNFFYQCKCWTLKEIAQTSIFAFFSFSFFFPSLCIGGHLVQRNPLIGPMGAEEMYGAKGIWFQLCCLDTMCVCGDL